jgi:hypothetical protein
MRSNRRGVECVVDLGDNWPHRWVVEPKRTGPLQENGECPARPVAIWGASIGSPRPTAASASTPTSVAQLSLSIRWQTTGAAEHHELHVQLRAVLVAGVEPA